MTPVNINPLLLLQCCEWPRVRVTLDGLLVALKSLQHVGAETLEGFVGGGKESVMSWLAQLLQQPGAVSHILDGDFMGRVKFSETFAGC